MIKIKNSSLLIAGACGGIGSRLLDEFIARGASKVYAAGINMANFH